MTPLVLHRLVPPASVETAGLYWRHEGPSETGRTGADIAPGTSLDLDTYFNSFDETCWRRHTSLDRLAVRLEIEGAARIELWRHSRHAPPALVAETLATGGIVTLDVPAPPHARASGRLALRILAPRRGRPGARLRGGDWRTQAAPHPVRLMPVICTFDRDPQLAALLVRLAGDAAVRDALGGIVVVNNGAPGLAARLGRVAGIAPLGAGLHVREQANTGGAGGFTRGMLEARALGATHVVLMDDDVEVEPEAVLRTLRLYQLATADMVVAGHMLDLFRPTHLYEGGARLDDAKLATVPLHLGAELAHPGSLDRFLHEAPMHYNGWWFMGLPLAVTDRLGYPMPCFIRGDDVEFGRRLHDAGTALVATPGIGIWHEPFYAKLGSWHVYYEFRNMFALAARHLPHPARTIRGIAVKWIVAELLMFRYARAALLLRATQDFLDGPAIYAEDPRRVHAGLAGVRAPYPVARMKRETVVHQPHPPVGPRGRAAFLVQLLRAMVGEWFRPDGTGRGTIAAEPRDHLWFRVRGADAVVVREAWEDDAPLYRRSRAAYRHLLRETASLAWRMRRLSATVAAWRGAHDRFTSETAWRRYLDLDETPGAGDVSARSAGAGVAQGGLAVAAQAPSRD